MGGSIVAAMVIGVVLTAIAFAHPAGPALMLAAETPFDAMPFVLFGVAGNAITYVPIVIFLIRTNPGYWGQAFIGSRVQQLAGLFLLALLYSHAIVIVDRGVGEIFEWLRKLTLFFLLAVFASAMRNPKHLALLAKVLVASMAAFVLVSMLDFYLGIQLMPVKAGRLETAALETEFESYLATNWRFTGPGFPVNRFSNYLLLPVFLGVGWFMSVRNPFQRAFAAGCTFLIVLGELLTVTRSGILGMVLGALIMMPMALRFRIQQVIGVVVVGTVLGALLWWGATLTSADQVIATRFDPSHVAYSTGGRLTRVVAALEIWSEHPFVGVGWGAFKTYSREHVASGGLGAHNGFTNVLAECGLLGFVPLVILFVAVVRRSLVRVGTVSPELEFWRPYFFCALIAQLVTNVFNDYLWERYLWVNFAFVIVLEQCWQVARAREVFARREQLKQSDADARATGPLAVRPS